ncbi:hypothetical protein Pta02_24920 [Planobispora takensis]|uniref:Uncharacterized protein n=1 Tax=Planobispora takensis TaxID=1367882 RepID=A0A8J3T3Q2_9ACTN|nr:hypothetical protein Pta02_24920 [Planobispora takensis]
MSRDGAADDAAGEQAARSEIVISVSAMPAPPRGPACDGFISHWRFAGPRRFAGFPGEKEDREDWGRGTGAPRRVGGRCPGAAGAAPAK